MSSSKTSTRPALAPSAGSAAKLYRVAGIAALVGALAYLIQPIIVFVVNPPTSGANGYPVAADLVAMRALAPLGIAEFTTIGIATFVLAIAVHRLRLSLGAPDGVPATTGLVLGVVAGIGWIAAAAGELAAYGLFATNLGEITSDPTQQQAAIQTALVGTGVLCISVIGSAGWLVLLGTSGRRAGVVGWALAVVALLGAAAIFIPAVVFLVPFGMLALIPLYAVLGIGFLIKSRRI